jgi:hypothetical protein
LPKKRSDERTADFWHFCAGQEHPADLLPDCVEACGDTVLRNVPRKDKLCSASVWIAIEQHHLRFFASVGSSNGREATTADQSAGSPKSDLSQ